MCIYIIIFYKICCSLVIRHHSGSSCAGFSRKGRSWDLTPFFAHQYKSLCRAEITLAALTLLLYTPRNGLSVQWTEAGHLSCGGLL